MQINDADLTPRHAAMMLSSFKITERAHSLQSIGSVQKAHHAKTVALRIIDALRRELLKPEANEP